MRAPTVDRLTPSDLAVLWPEDLGWPQDVGMLAILDGAGCLDVDRLRAHVGSRIGLLPSPFRKVLVRPRRGLGRPYWVDAPGLDLEYHVRTVTLPAGAGERELLEACEAVRRRRFDPAHPLWHLTLIAGLPDRRVGLFMDAHHCLVDGIAGVAALLTFVMVATVLFSLIRAAARFKRADETQTPDTDEVLLLREIRDLLSTQPDNPGTPV